MGMETLEQLFRSRVRAFLGRTGLGPTTFGMKALGDPNLWRQIDRGRSLSLRTADRILAFIADYDLDTGGARAPPRPEWGRRSSSRTRSTRSSRAMTEQPMEQRTNPPTRFVRLPEVVFRTGLSHSTLKARMRGGCFPRPGALGARRGLDRVGAGRVDPRGDRGKPGRRRRCSPLTSQEKGR